MFKPFVDAYFQYCKMAMDTAAVLNYRLPMLHSMASDPAILWSPVQWYEVNTMISEKLLSFGQAYMLLAMNLVQLPYGKLPSVEKVMQIQRKTLQPVKTALSANARRFEKKKN